MKMDVNNDSIRIWPESPQDIAYLEHVLGMVKGGDHQQAMVCRMDSTATGKMGYIKIEKGLD